MQAWLRSFQWGIAGFAEMVPAGASVAEENSVDCFKCSNGAGLIDWRGWLYVSMGKTTLAEHTPEHQLRPKGFHLSSNCLFVTAQCILLSSLQTL